MRADPSAEKLFEAEGRIARIRLVTCGFICVGYLLIDPASTLPAVALSVLLVGVVYSAAVLWWRPSRPRPLRVWSYGTTFIDAVLFALWLHGTGGYDSPFKPLVFMAVATVGVRYVRWTELVAGTAIFAGSFLLLMGFLGELGSHITEITVLLGALGLFAWIMSWSSYQSLRDTAAKHEAGERARAAEAQIEQHRRFAGEVVAAQEAERRRLARELHDETGQALTSLIVGLRTLEHASSPSVMHYQAQVMRRLAEQTASEVGRLARGLHPSALDDLGFKAAVERYAADYQRRFGIKVDLHVRGLERAADLPGTVSSTLYRIFQEALNNVAKHAGAHSVSVVVDKQPSRVCAIIEDDGRGMGTDELRIDPKGHLGLVSIKERAELLHGTVMVESTPGIGTTLRVEIPLDAA